MWFYQSCDKDFERSPIKISHCKSLEHAQKASRYQFRSQIRCNGILEAADYTVDSRYLEIEGTLKNSSRYPFFDISDL